MSDDRLAQIEDEAARRYPVGPVGMFEPALRAAFQRGAEWADANPPRTITRAELDEAATRFAEVGASGDWVSLEDMLVVALGALGIEVVDDE